MSILGIPELIKRLKAAFASVNVLLGAILSIFKTTSLSRYFPAFIKSKNYHGLELSY